MGFVEAEHRRLPLRSDAPAGDDLTELHIRDSMCVAAPSPDRLGSKAVLTLAGSTNLTYYELVRVNLRGVRYRSVPERFSHPAFRLASPAEERQLRDLVPFGKRSFGVRVLTEFGSPLQTSAYVVADWLDVQRVDSSA